MPPTFQELMPCTGVDEHPPSGAAAIVVPLGPKGEKGSNAVVLADGPGLHVASTTLAVQVDEITDPGRHPNWAKLLPLVIPIHKLNAGAIKIFNISSNSLVGWDVAKVQATKTNERTSKAEATLKVVVLSYISKTISIRPTQVRDGHGNKVSFNAPVDPQRLLDEMNSIWKPQANIEFKLGRTDPALIEGLKPDSKADVNDLLDSFVKSKDPTADLTMFLVRKAFDKREVDGVTRAKQGIALISDARLSNRTFAHEAGHFLGSLNEHGKYSQDYGEQGTNPDYLMSRVGSGRRIPYSQVPDFNKGYRRG
jgi:hypothetical protein